MTNGFGETGHLQAHLFYFFVIMVVKTVFIYRFQQKLWPGILQEQPFPKPAP